MLSLKNTNVTLVASKHSGCHLTNGTAAQTEGSAVRNEHASQPEGNAEVHGFQSVSKGSVALFLMTLFTLYVLILRVA